jgi:hypothetical protein
LIDSKWQCFGLSLIVVYGSTNLYKRGDSFHNNDIQKISYIFFP